ncbi:peptidoglycan editing factor PgeF [Algimonas arctica]|uniref:peptidoglycan editing factor PgeF n=1 Tax=Algimonas arctica TaxID=1479486 RepID=UPI0035709AAE
MFTTHPNLKSRHLFAGRQGGVSTGIYASLNTGLYSGDDPEAVNQNRALVCEALGAGHLVSLRQIHSDDVEIIESPPTEPIRADGLVTKTPGLAISAQSADCGPLLLEDTDAGVIAACHAGWRGALSGIVESTIAAMCEVGAHPDNISAVLGPCISQPNYEAGDAFMAEFTDVNADYAKYFVSGPSGIPHFDLPAFILSRLADCGVENRNWVGQCTYADEAKFFSYRRNTHQGLEGYGRNISAIVLPH